MAEDQEYIIYLHYKTFNLIFLFCFVSSVLRELKSRFGYYMQTGDISKIPADLQRITFLSVRRHDEL